MVTRLGFGGIPIQRVSEAEAIAVVRRCVELGITFFDTANSYTTSEERIGKALAGRRSDIIIATKTQARRRDDIEKHLNLSLQRLGVKAIDLYQLHNVSDAADLKTVLDPKGPLATLHEAKKAGLIKHIGVTSHNMDIAKTLVESDRFETIMFPFNFLTPEVRDELLPLVKEHDMGYIAMKPLAGGMLEDVNIALKYLLQFPEVVIIPGVERITEIDQIVSIVANPQPLTRAEYSKMQRLKKELGKHFCHRCDYCLPCSEGIHISVVMQTKSFIKRAPPQSLLSGGIATALEKASDCSQCGECETRCPYKLPIRELIEENSNLYQEFKRQHMMRSS
jgi:predicted aldo/keto reductase-like oxidoreductase